MRIAVVLLGLVACGGGWSDADTKSATDAVRAQLLVQNICAPDAGCPPAQVRALERASLCSNESMLFRHGHAVPDGGPECRP